VRRRLNVEGDILTISVQREEKKDEQKTANGVKCAPPHHPAQAALMLATVFPTESASSMRRSPGPPGPLHLQSSCLVVVMRSAIA